MKIIDINGNKRDCLNVSPDEKWPGFLRVDFESKNRTSYRHSEWYPITEFFKNNPGLADSVKNTPLPPNEDLGVVSSSKNLSLTDKSKKWKVDVYAGFPVWISRGKGEGQTRNIVSNTGNTITLDKPWKDVPNSTSQYVISQNVHNPKKFDNKK